MVELDLPQDYKDLLLELLDADAEFVVVGGWAVAVHGYARATDDLDIFVRSSPDNADRIFAALQRFGAPLDAHGVTAGLFAREGYGYRIGRKPVLIELLTTVDGIDFDEAVSESVTVTIDGRSVPIIGRSALLANKRAAGRPKDLADVDALTEQDEDS